MFCPECGTQIAEKASFCHKCGTKISYENITKNSKDISAKMDEPENSGKETLPQASVGDSNMINHAGKVSADNKTMRSCIDFFISIGSKSFVLLAIYATISAIFGFSINKTLVVIGLALGFIGMIMRFFGWLLEKSKILVYGVLIGCIFITIITVVLLNGSGENDIAVSSGGALQDDSKVASGNRRIEINETQSYDNNFGNIEVTLNYVEFVDKLENTLTGDSIYPDEDSVFLWAAITVKNIGTQRGSLLTAWNTVVYDGTYEFVSYAVQGEPLIDINPLNSPTEGAIIFMVPRIVEESDKSLVLNINDGGGKAVISYILKPDIHISSQDNAVATIDNEKENGVPIVDVCFNDIPISELLNSSSTELVYRFGNGYYADGEGRISYDEIEFYMLDDETVGSIWSFCPGCFSINGHALDVDSEGVIYSDEIVELLGTDYEDESLSGGYYMTYYYPTYTLSFGINKFSEVSDIGIYNLINGGNETSDYLSGDISTGYYEPIEKYWKLAGAYAGNTSQATLSLSIYSSQEEGEAEIGTAEIYTSNGQYYLGAVIPIEENVYKVMADVGEEILLAETASGEGIVLQLYVDRQYCEEYQMTEHYES